MSEDEKKAIWHCASILAGNKNDLKHWKILENYIEKLQKENKELKEDISNMYDEKVVRNILEDECGLSKNEIEEILN